MEIMISIENGLLCHSNDEHPQHPTTQILRRFLTAHSRCLCIIIARPH